MIAGHYYTLKRVIILLHGEPIMQTIPLSRYCCMQTFRHGPRRMIQYDAREDKRLDVVLRWRCRGSCHVQPKLAFQAGQAQACKLIPQVEHRQVPACNWLTRLARERPIQSPSLIVALSLDCRPMLNPSPWRGRSYFALFGPARNGLNTDNLE